MKKQNLQTRLDRLKAHPGLRDMAAFFGNCYDAIRQMDETTSPPNIGEEAAWEFSRLQREGTKENFVNQKNSQWKIQHNRGGK